MSFKLLTSVSVEITSINEAEIGLNDKLNRPEFDHLK